MGEKFDKDIVSTKTQLLISEIIERPLQKRPFAH